MAPGTGLLRCEAGSLPRNCWWGFPKTISPFCRFYFNDDRGHRVVLGEEPSSLLANTDEPIEQVADQTGFPNRSYFSRVFQGLTGESPARFRRRYSARVGVLGPATRTLSSREIAVLDYLAKGFLYKEIAASLGISYGTIHTHIEHLYAKLGVRSRAQAVARYLHA